MSKYTKAENESRAHRAKETIEHYRNQTGNLSSINEATIDLLTDIMHLVGEGWDELYERAFAHYEREVKEA